MEEIHPGPTVTTYEVSPAGRNQGLQGRFASPTISRSGFRARFASSRRSPARTASASRSPTSRACPVSLRELVEDQRFVGADRRRCRCVLGRDIVGAPYFADLASMPHVIVAGATGAGKSVGLNVMLTSLLFRRTPEELRLLMIDPKVVELAPFDRIPHMLLPVVTDMKQAANALKWAVDEMERRYQLFANAGTKNIAHLQRLGRAACIERRARRSPARQAGHAIGADGEPVTVVAPPRTDATRSSPRRIPFIVIVVDEFADLMMQQGKDVEAARRAAAQKARAAGMHVILATQRPSVDVITGMIKANFPTRIAFRVAQKVDSRTILDEQGAEHLLGRGDMLIKMNGTTRRAACSARSSARKRCRSVTDFLRAAGHSPSTTRTSSSRATTTASRRGRRRRRAATRFTTRRCASSPTRGAARRRGCSASSASATTGRRGSSRSWRSAGSSARPTAPRTARFSSVRFDPEPLGNTRRGGERPTGWKFRSLR